MTKDARARGDRVGDGVGDGDDAFAGSMRSINRRFRLVFLCAAAPLVALVLTLAWRACTSAFAEEVALHLEALQTRRTGLEQLAGATAQHVAVMQAYIRHDIETGRPDRTLLPEPDWPGRPRPVRQAGFGILLSPGPIGQDDVAAAQAALALFPLARAAHEAKPCLQWSYFFAASRAFVAIWPYAAPESFLGGDDPAAVLRGYFDYPLYRMALPDANPAGESFWTPAYLDAGGAGLMVTHGAPVHAGGVFRGMVGTDVLLTVLSDYLAGFGPISGQIAVVDQAGSALADPERRALAAGETPIRAESILRLPPQTVPDGTFRRVGDQRIAALPVGGTPWTVAMTVREAELRAAALARAAPLGVLLAGILAAFAALALGMRAQFVRPAVALARLGAEGGAAGLLPGPWRPMGARITAEAGRREDRITTLRAMFDGVPVRAIHLDSRFMLRDANHEAIEFTGQGRDAILGRPVEEVMGPVARALLERHAPRLRAGETIRWEGWSDDARHGRRFVLVTLRPFRTGGDTEPGFLSSPAT